MLGELMRVKDGVAVAGSHGKTSTTTMVATILAHAGLDPTASLAAKPRYSGPTRASARARCWSRRPTSRTARSGTFCPWSAVITNIDREHMDHFGTEAALRSAFLAFANQVPFYGVVVVCADNPTAAGLLPDLVKRHVSYGLAEGDYRGEIMAADAQGTRLRVSVRGKARGEVVVRMPGVHYAQNALAALCVADVFGVPFRTSCEALAGFGGVDSALFSAR